MAVSDPTDSSALLLTSTYAPAAGEGLHLSPVKPLRKVLDAGGQSRLRTRHSGAKPSPGPPAATCVLAFGFVVSES